METVRTVVDVVRQLVLSANIRESIVSFLGSSSSSTFSHVASLSEWDSRFDRKRRGGSPSLFTKKRKKFDGGRATKSSLCRDD